MFRRRHFELGLSIAALLLTASLPACTVLPAPQASNAELGSWRESGLGGGLIRFEASRMIIKEEGPAKAVTVLGRHGDEWAVRNLGLEEVWRVRQTGKHLEVVQQDGSVKSYSRLLQDPPELDLKPLQLGDSKLLSVDNINKIKEELLRRRDEDQAVRVEASRQKDQKAVDEANWRFLTQLLQDVGWIDSERFGAGATKAALLLAKHTGDPRLMQAILPLAERDVQRKVISGELYSVLYDGLQISLGQKQKYGTQIAEDEAGPFVVPLMDPLEVDAYRSAIGLPPLQEYLALASQTLFEGRQIRLGSAD